MAEMATASRQESLKLSLSEAVDKFSSGSGLTFESSIMAAFSSCG